MASEVPSLEEVREALFKGLPLDPYGFVKVVATCTGGYACVDFRIYFRNAMRGRYCVRLEGLPEVWRFMQKARKGGGWQSIEALVADLRKGGVPEEEVGELLRRVEEKVVPWLARLRIACSSVATVSRDRVRGDAVVFGDKSNGRALVADAARKLVFLWRWSDVMRDTVCEETTFYFGWPCDPAETAKELLWSLLGQETQYVATREVVEAVASLAVSDPVALVGFVATLIR